MSSLHKLLRNRLGGGGGSISRALVENGENPGHVPPYWRPRRDGLVFPCSVKEMLCYSAYIISEVYV
jgi:hypothetical protein